MNWNGKLAAVSLTFDDGTPGQYEYAFPELTKRGMLSTFFLVSNPANCPRKYDTHFRTSEWKAALAAGHEIGGHSATHLDRAVMDANLLQARQDILNGKSFLEAELDTVVRSYAYPFEYAQGVEEVVSKNFLQARGMGSDAYITAPTNYYRFPSLRVREDNAERAWTWVDEAIKKRAWIILMLHGIGTPERFDNVPVNKFNNMLSDIQGRDVWVAPFGTVAEYCRSHQCLKPTLTTTTPAS